MNSYDKYEVEAKKYYLDINFTSDKDKAFNTLEELYRYVKSIQEKYLHDGIINTMFLYVSDEIYKSEEIFGSDFIIESNPNFNINEFKDKVSISDKKECLRWIIHMAREELTLDYPEIKGSTLDILKKATMSDRCTKSSAIVQKYCEKNNINSKRYIIYPGFKKDAHLFGKYRFHAFNIVNIYGKDYIVDLTYRQFFCKDQSSLERTGVFNLTGTLPGRFMIMNTSRLKTATKLLKDGYIEMTEENIKNYFDGFAISFRNGTFYDLKEDYSYTTNYSPYDYLRFINGYDSQYNHEGEEVLGYQRKKLIRK